MDPSRVADATSLRLITMVRLSKYAYNHHHITEHYRTNLT